MRLVPLTALVVALIACGSYTGIPGPRGSGPAIEAEEIRSLVDATDAYQIVRRLRPQSLRAPDATSPFGTGHAGGAILVSTFR